MQEQTKGKPVTTSVPSISIRFHANAEQLEELYASEEEHESTSKEPLKYLPRLVKRSTSIDITPNAAPDASPPSDPWRFFSDIKGKITKSVEEKFTEIKARNQENESGSPLKKPPKDSKDNSSVSDSEDLSESSISKTCGIVSTTEGAEMSTDDDTPSIECDRKVEVPVLGSSHVGLRQRFRLLKNKSSKQGTMDTTAVSKLSGINMDKIEQALPEEDIESGVEAMESVLTVESYDMKEVLSNLASEYENIEVDAENVINVHEVSGTDIRPGKWPDHRSRAKAIFAPVGFVDMRQRKEHVHRHGFLPIVIMAVVAVLYFLIHRYSSYMAGIILGMFLTYIFYYGNSMIFGDEKMKSVSFNDARTEFIEIPSVREIHPIAKYEGWLNEFPETYNPHTYHISQTQSVFLRLQGNLLRISHTRSKIPKRALWNEPEIRPIFTHHRVYNLFGAKIAILPDGLAKKRQWSKKYPICITINNDNQMRFESAIKGEEEEESLQSSESTSSVSSRPKKKFSFTKKKYTEMAQRFSKLTEENEDYELDSETSRPSTPSPDTSDMNRLIYEDLTKNDENDEEEEDADSFTDDWATFTPDESPTETKIYLFGRTDRDKEDWFRRFIGATHKSATTIPDETDDNISSASKQNLETISDYVKYMLTINKTVNELNSNKEVVDKNSIDSIESTNSEESLRNMHWVNSFIGRILFDCLRNEKFTQRIKDRIQRKMAAIKLPYFIEGLLVTELSLGQTAPIFRNVTNPVLDERGLWVDIDITYQGLIYLILQTKLNLMKLKQPHGNERNKENSAMFNSDVDDSAESTSDEEAMPILQYPPALDVHGQPLVGLGGTSTKSKKFMKMVDRIAESRFFQAATENRYIKKAMEGVSNTDLRLRVEIKELVGTLVLNIPPPPSDRLWVGFKTSPQLSLIAMPIVGERNITNLRVMAWIEKKLKMELQKLLVIPNMEDITIPVMNPKLPV